MAHSTRSQRTTPPTEAEMEIREKRLEAQENQLREQTQALRQERDELARQNITAVEISSLLQTINQLQTELSSVKEITEKFHQLERRVNEATVRTTMIPEPPVTPVPNVVSNMRLKDVLPIVPNFDGYRISVYQFARACERARNLLPDNQEASLVQMLINKLEGDAYQIVEGAYFHTVTALLDKLKSIFAPCRSVAHYRGELANTYKFYNESVLKYAGRIKNLKTAILDSQRREKGLANREFTEDLDREVLDAFISGLPSELITRIEHRTITNLDEAIELAIRLSRTLDEEKARYHPSRDGRPQRAENRPSQPPPEAPRYNKLPGRPQESRPYVPQSRGSHFTSQGRTVPGTEVCRYCKIPGHDISECRKLAYRNSFQNQQSGNARRVPGPQNGNRDVSPKKEGTIATITATTSEATPGTSRVQTPSD